MLQTEILARDSARETAGSYNYAIGYLRAFVVVLVVAHHAALAYYQGAPAPPSSLFAEPRWWLAFPVADSQHTFFATLLVGFNDIFFMSLMFLLSGLFVSSGLRQRGPAAFLKGRAARLGVPFLFAAAILAPLAYYPTYLQIAAHDGIAGFVRQWLALGVWPAGPAWFIWVLLVFDCAAVLLFAAAPQWAGAFGRFLAGPKNRPARFFALLTIVSAAVYIPMELRYSSLAWAAFGPFTFQTSRIFHYLLYFLAGAGIGAVGLDRGPLTSDGKLARRWWIWAVSAVVMFLALSTVVIMLLTSHLQSLAWRVSADALFAVSCATSSFAFLALFLRFARRQSDWFGSLSRNSYGIYLLHYGFVSWVQLALTGAAIPAMVKFGVVVSVALAASWSLSGMLRRLPGVARVV